LGAELTVPLACLQCAIKALALGAPAPPPTRETPEAHIARLHPSPARMQLERALYTKLITARLAKGN
jgi:hypothetical protein